VSGITPDLTFHSRKQRDAALSNSPITVLATGIQFGKTTAGAFWLKRHIHAHTNQDDNFLICSPTHKIMQQSTLPAFFKMMHGYGDYSKADAAMRIHGGGMVYMRTGTDPDSIVGITNIRAVYGDEAGLFSLYFWENIQARAAFRSAPIMLTTSPYTLNWLYKDIIRPKMKSSEARPDVMLVQASSVENPYFPRDVYERNRLTMDVRRFNAMFGGNWERMSGLVYDCFSEDENIVAPFTLPPGTKYFGGIDWGYYPDPFVFKIRAVTPDGMHFDVHEECRHDMTATDIVALLKGLYRMYNVQVSYCDPSEPAMIEELNRAKLSAIGADNSIRLGLDRHYELVKTRRYKIFAGTSPHTLDELELYHYPEPKDLLPDRNSTSDNLPVDQSNHTMDAMRYCTMGTWGLQDKRQPFVPEEGKRQLSDYERIERLKRANRRNSSEKWS